MNIVAKRTISLLLLGAFAAALYADVVSMNARITRTMVVADDRWGGCAAQLSVAPADHGLANCTSRWVTFSCSGVHTTKSRGLAMFDQAQTAFVLDRPVRIFVDDSKTHNGLCFVDRIQLLEP